MAIENSIKKFFMLSILTKREKTKDKETEKLIGLLKEKKSNDIKKEGRIAAFFS
jgi:hypothetical protein